MKDIANFFNRFIATAIVTASIFGATIASADTYRAGEFTITLGRNNIGTGRTYRGCDSKGKCLDLNNGTAWRDAGNRGTTWENKEYSYSISYAISPPEDPNQIEPKLYLTIYKNKTRILRRPLVPIAN